MLVKGRRRNLKKDTGGGGRDKAMTWSVMNLETVMNRLEREKSLLMNINKELFLCSS